MNIIDQLNSLEKIVKEEGVKINKKSIEIFLNFLNFMKYMEINPQLLSEATLSLTPVNEFYLSFKKENIKHSFRFKADGTIKHITIG